MRAPDRLLRKLQDNDFDTRDKLMIDKGKTGYSDRRSQRIDEMVDTVEENLAQMAKLSEERNAHASAALTAQQRLEVQSPSAYSE